MAVRSTTVFISCTLTLLGCHAGPPRSTLAGVYTAEQAAHGKDVYAGMCMTCHAGMGNHVGPVFRARWGGHDLQELYGYIGDNMPKNDPGSLSPDDDASVVAYLLQLNAMPAGKTPLSTDTTMLKTIRIDTVATKR
jgi:mono/diheme cytochrome c family protein